MITHFYGKKPGAFFPSITLLTNLPPYPVKFLINKHPSLHHKGKVLKINNKMTFQAQICILTHASQNQATFQRHCFKHFKNLIYY